MNQEYITTTLLGFPLRMKLNATATLSYQSEGGVKNFDLMNGKVNIEGNVRPSIVIGVDESIKVAGDGFQSGVVKTSTTMARADISGRVVINGGNLIDVDLNVPEGEMVKISSFSR